MDGGGEGGSVGSGEGGFGGFGGLLRSLGSALSFVDQEAEASVLLLE